MKLSEASSSDPVEKEEPSHKPEPEKDEVLPPTSDEPKPKRPDSMDLTPPTQDAPLDLSTTAR